MSTCNEASHMTILTATSTRNVRSGAAPADVGTSVYLTDLVRQLCDAVGHFFIRITDHRPRKRKMARPVGPSTSLPPILQIEIEPPFSDVVLSCGV